AGHLSRADDWMNLLQKLALVICPLNPALAWVERRLCFERELACDERVLRTTGAPKAYAACLASLAEHRLGRRSLALALGALGRESELARRVRRILCRPQRMRPLHARLLLGGAVLGLVAAAAGLERFPQLVGFASSADAAAAATQPPHLDARVPDGFVFQPVVFHPPASRIVGSPANLPRAIHTPQTGRRKPLARPTVPWTAPSNAATYPPLQASVTESAASRTIELATQPAQGQDDDPSVSNAIAPAADRAVVQWLVVTSWREQDGSRLTLTTFHSVRTTAEAAPASGNQSLPAQDQVHPFAAVPVRGGWLVIQL
ncbi:MAG TPA: M56 family metallopeptidase, partial [Acidobacteriaceae bacterium]|nr:M56 family metallopeptidase [Acidobacteriaceae bacterium]